MSSSSSKDAQGNIFLTTENLAFSMPLILVCASYAYFKFVPLEYGVPALLGVGLILFLRGQLKKVREKKIENMDESDINDLANELEGEEDEAAKKKKEEKDKQLQKKKARLAERLAAEQRKEEKAAKKSQNTKKKNATEADDDDIDAAVFAKGSRNQKKKKN